MWMMSRPFQHYVTQFFGRTEFWLRRWKDLSDSKNYFNSVVTFIAPYLVPLISSNYVVVGSVTKPENAQIPVIHNLAKLFVIA